MTLGSEDWLGYDEKNLAKIPSVPGTYLFADKKRSVIYIGNASNLRRTLLNAYTAQSTRFRDVTFFSVSMNPDHRQAFRKLLTQYREENDRRLPACNVFDELDGTET